MGRECSKHGEEMENVMGKECSKHGEEKKYIHGFDGKVRKKETTGRILT
jgi:hypothetical protein